MVAVVKFASNSWVAGGTADLYTVMSIIFVNCRHFSTIYILGYVNNLCKFRIFFYDLFLVMPIIFVNSRYLSAISSWEFYSFNTINQSPWPPDPSYL
ncbi:hypothetical protein PV327_010307 [Microctonus hyperodae]|uniref:Uncharacterized protein n=1 Tax=Microctonus hyperodae TaxID=165561 RepID=A0AA39FRM4_MICHY|nr:hypothetical protein PV327_010307 [Microctonus hyperodae]